MKNKKSIYLFCCVSLCIYASCKKEKLAKNTDKEIFEIAKNASGYIWFKKSDTLLNKSSGSGHNFPFLRTRFNSIASTKLDANGKIISNASFPEGSVIVKELYSNKNTLGRYAVLYKQSSNKDADNNGWVWGYVNADGTVASKASDNTISCTSCHLQSENIDYMLMNKYFP